MSASEAIRSFSALLRQVAQGRSFTVHSHGRLVAHLTPVNQGPSTAARRALLTRLATQPASSEARSWGRDDLYDSPAAASAGLTATDPSHHWLGSRAERH